jgi:2-polyprenyl-3-methyl-5-hydroxy-6-metoxy-1,4-benzoquinol methylase
MSVGKCRFCDAPLTLSFVDLGAAPLSNAFLRADDLDKLEPFYALHAFVCQECRLVQVVHSVSPQELFREYAYFSSYSESWLRHAGRYADEISHRLRLDAGSLVVEVASNDGYLLKYFKEKGIPVLGLEPAHNVAHVARSAGIPTIEEFFGVETATELFNSGQKADLLIGNNVLAHVPDLNDFVQGLKILLRPGGTITMEFPHLLRLMLGNQFDTIYHEHFSYFSLMSAERVFAAHGLTVFDVEELSTHGGSLRIHVGHTEDRTGQSSERLHALRKRELEAGLARDAAYSDFGLRVQRTKRKLLDVLIEIKNQNKSIAGYGAPAKGNILLNYCGIRTDFLAYTVDLNPYKQGLFTAGTRIPICPPEKISETKPDYVLILPWNLKEEIMDQMRHVKDWGGKFIVPVPEVEIL